MPVSAMKFSCLAAAWALLAVGALGLAQEAERGVSTRASIRSYIDRATGSAESGNLGRSLQANDDRLQERYRVWEQSIAKTARRELQYGNGPTPGCNCPPPEQCYNNQCVCPGKTGTDYSNDNNNCGSCGYPCPSGQTCTNSQCGCPSGQLGDNNNCQACGVPCPGGSTCGIDIWNHQPPPSHDHDHDHDHLQGYRMEERTSSSHNHGPPPPKKSYSYSCGCKWGKLGDDWNCGGCGVKCQDYGHEFKCSNNACVPPTCHQGTWGDSYNCGHCDNHCHSGRVCEGGQCVIPPPPPPPVALPPPPPAYVCGADCTGGGFTCLANNTCECLPPRQVCTGSRTGPCLDVGATDADNCGRCGNSCPSRVCNAGVCAPVGTVPPRG